MNYKNSDIFCVTKRPLNPNLLVLLWMSAAFRDSSQYCGLRFHFTSLIYYVYKERFQSLRFMS